MTGAYMSALEQHYKSYIHICLQKILCKETSDLRNSEGDTFKSPLTLGLYTY